MTQYTDRELLEWAAKAAGIEGEWQRDPAFAQERWAFMVGYNNQGMMTAHEWNPLTDDGDALRLAGRLYLTVKIERHECEVFDSDVCLSSEPIANKSEQPAATRRAIVRAAAAIGKEGRVE